MAPPPGACPRAPFSTARGRPFLIVVGSVVRPSRVQREVRMNQANEI